MDDQNGGASIDVADFTQLRQTINTSFMDAKWKAAYLEDLSSLYRFAEARLLLPTRDPRIVDRMQVLQRDVKRDARRADETTQAVAGAERDEEETTGRANTSAKAHEASDEASWRRADEHAVALMNRKQRVQSSEQDASAGASREE